MAHQTSWAGRSLGKFPEFWWQKTFNTGCDVGEIRICCSWSPGGKMFHYRRFHIKFRTTSNCFFFAQIISETERDIFFLNFLEIFLRHFFLRLRDNFCRQRGGALHCFPSSITTTDTKENTHPDCETYRRGCFKIKNIYIYLEWLIRTWTEVRLLEKRKTFFSNVFQKKKRREKMFVYKYASVKRLDNFRQFYI